MSRRCLQGRCLQGSGASRSTRLVRVSYHQEPRCLGVSCLTAASRSRVSRLVRASRVSFARLASRSPRLQPVSTRALGMRRVSRVHVRRLRGSRRVSRNASRRASPRCLRQRVSKVSPGAKIFRFRIPIARYLRSLAIRVDVRTRLPHRTPSPSPPRRPFCQTRKDPHQPAKQTETRDRTRTNTQLT